MGNYSQQSNSSEIVQLGADHYPLAIAHLGIGGCALGGNGLILIVFFKDKTLRTKDCLYLIAGLATADSILGVGLFAFGINTLLETWRWMESKEKAFTKMYCLCFECFNILGMTMSQMMIAVIGLDRVIALSDAVQYRFRNHAKYALVAFGTVVTYAIPTTAAVFVANQSLGAKTFCSAEGTWSDVYRAYWAAFCCSVCLVILLVYAGCLVMIRYKLHSTFVSVSAQEARQLERQRRVTNTVVTVLAVYSGAWVVPSAAYNLVNLITLSSKQHLAGVVGPYMGLGAGVNSCLNIVIYSFKYKEIKSSIMRLFGVESSYSGSNNNNNNMTAGGSRMVSRVAPMRNETAQNVAAPRHDNVAVQARNEIPGVP